MSGIGQTVSVCAGLAGMNWLYLQCVVLVGFMVHLLSIWTDLLHGLFNV